MNKKVVILLSIIVLLIGLVCGFLFGVSDKEKSGNDIIYKTLSGMTTDKQIELYQSKLTANTSPSELKYLLGKIIPKVNANQSDGMIAQYLNHVQYFSGTYSDFLNIYASIIVNNMSTIDYTTIDCVDMITDRVLKNLVLEIYEGDMKIVLPAAGTEGTPYVTTNYDSITSAYNDKLSDVTKDYIGFKTVELPKIANNDGSINFTSLEDFMVKANSFIVKYPQYVLIDDIKYTYVVAAQMYMNVYNVYEEFEPDKQVVAQYREFIKGNPNTPISPALKEIIEVSDNGGVVTMAKINEYQTGLMSLIDETGELSSQLSSQGEEIIANQIEAELGDTLEDVTLSEADSSQE